MKSFAKTENQEKVCFPETETFSIFYNNEPLTKFHPSA